MIRRILILALIFTLVPISSAAAAPSKTVEDAIILSPNYQFEIAEENEEWPKILELIDETSEEYELIEAIKVNINEPCEWLYVKLVYPLTTEQEPFVLIINNNYEIAKQEIGFDEDGRACIDLINYDVGEYWICFYVKKGNT